jgi:HPr kinase/phosphorylase
MLQISVARLYEDNREKLGLTPVGEPPRGETVIRRDTEEAAALIGLLNLTHPNRIQVFGKKEAARLSGCDDAAASELVNALMRAQPAAIVLCDGVAVLSRPMSLLESASRTEGVAMFTTPLHDADLIDVLRRYLAKKLAEATERHGVCMDVLGLGVLITGDSGVGKSELGLELISRGHGLVADDVVEISRMPPRTLECRCPPMLKDFLEVRGLGVLNIRTIFGETAVRPKMNLRLIVHLERPSRDSGVPVERLPLHELSEDILGVTVRKVVIPVAAGRNLAVLLEAAVRNHILHLRGINSTQEFIARQQAEMKKNVG